MSKIVKNTTASPYNITDVGVTIPATSSYLIPPQDYLLWAASSVVVTGIGSGDLVINDGSFDLNVNEGTALILGLFPTAIFVKDDNNINIFNTVSSVASNATTTLLNYTVPPGNTLSLFEIEVSGDNIAFYQVYLNASLIAQKRTYFGGGLNERFLFGKGNSSYLLNASDNLQVKVTHYRPFAGAFEARVIGVLK